MRKPGEVLDYLSWVISRTLRLYPTREQAARLEEWFQIGTGAWNWALGRMRDTRNEIGPRRAGYASLCRETRGHAARVGFHAMAFQGVLKDVCRAWDDYRSGIRGEPHRKGARNWLASLPFRNDKRTNNLRFQSPKVIRLPGLGDLRCRGTRGLPSAPICTARIQRKARGWYVTVVLDAEPQAIPLMGNAAVGVDLGYSTLATLSTGEMIENPNEYRRLETRLAQMQRSRSKRRNGRFQQSIALARRTRNHAISRDLVSRFGAIYVSRDNVRGLQRRFGKSVLNAGHGELLTMLASKCRQAGRVYVEVPSRNSTRTCSSCGALTGPTGLRGLSVREWGCSACGARHDRDVNAACVTLIHGAVLAHESRRESASETSGHR